MLTRLLTGVTICKYPLDHYVELISNRYRKNQY